MQYIKYANRETANTPVFGISSCEQSLISLLSASVFISAEMSPTHTRQMFTCCKQPHSCISDYLHWQLNTENIKHFIICAHYSVKVLTRKHDKNFSCMPFFTSLTIGTGHEFAMEQSTGKGYHLHLQTKFGENRCTQFPITVVTDIARPQQIGPITIHCAAMLSMQCN